MLESSRILSLPWLASMACASGFIEEAGADGPAWLQILIGYEKPYRVALVGLAHTLPWPDLLRGSMQVFA